MPSCWTSWSVWSRPNRYGSGWPGSSCSPCTAAARRARRWRCTSGSGAGSPTSSAGIRVVLVDDHPLFRTGLRVALETGTDIAVVAEAGGVHEAIDAVARVRPDVVLMDLHLPDGSGVEATRLLTVRHDDVPVLVMTMSEEDEAIVAALGAGARGYLVKSAGREEILSAVRAVACGGSVFSAGIAARLAILAGARPRSPTAG